MNLILIQENKKSQIHQVSLRNRSYFEKRIAEQAAELSVVSSVDAIVYSNYNEKLIEIS